MKPSLPKQRRVTVTLRNKAFKSNIMWKSFWKNLKQQRDVDIKLSCENKLIGAHKAVLFCASKCFEVKRNHLMDSLELNLMIF